MQLHMLGKSHAQKSIRPWQYSVFVQTLLITIASRLGGKATSDVMEAWVNLFAFVMKSMLPQAIRGQVVETELNINTSSEFANGRVADEVAEQEALKEMNKRFKKGGFSTGASSNPSARHGNSQPGSRGGSVHASNKGLDPLDESKDNEI
jgi:hypothetical protein